MMWIPDGDAGHAPGTFAAREVSEALDVAARSRHAGERSATVLLPAEQVRHPQRRLADLGGVIEPSSAALDVDRIRDGPVHAFKQVLAVKLTLEVAGGGPLEARLDRCQLCS
jgi:hypothetical protein